MDDNNLFITGDNKDLKKSLDFKIEDNCLFFFLKPKLFKIHDNVILCVLPIIPCC